MRMIERFTRAERALHWSTALTVFFLMGSGFWMWMGWAKGHTLVGFRYAQVHFWVGAVVFVGAALLFLAFGRRRVAGHETRFNTGQKVNLLAMQAALPFMLVSGTVLHFAKGWGLSRDLSNVVKLLHLGSAGLIALAVVGHIVLVVTHRRLIRGMVVGSVAPTDVPHWTPAASPVASPAPKRGWLRSRL
ncbi:MAG: Prokaryotic cytochrome b561 [Cyanobacteria bacterium RYN_339]|nr:Prokaryotic cytochrome b561 [Cyanobacteria bacterium RYN_339]